ncbi:MAG: thiamine pyrophosphate-dependent enzyme, partial [Thermoanaerobaculia bacterium]|nr:thiamine pyrophosphate-dependent enzyme [Thermoanaerobaculia bacterium]
ERGEDILFVCYDNEIYGNTGGQRSSATPLGARTTTTDRGKREGKKDILGIMAAHGIPYAASVSLAHPEDALRKMRHALEERGFRFLHVLSPCPTGWKAEPADGVELLRLAVTSGLYPVCEIFDGERWVVNEEPTFDFAAMKRYFSLQGRFRDGVDLRRVSREVSRHWRKLRSLVAAGEAFEDLASA